MGNTYYKIYVHIVWSTKNREKMINLEIEELLKAVVTEKANKFKSKLIAIGGIDNHVHVLFSISPETNIADMIKSIKGTTSYFINHWTNSNLYWQDGYSIFSVSESVVEKLVKYIENQKEHHKENRNVVDALE